jgi:hypothetical protein
MRLVLPQPVRLAPYARASQSLFPPRIRARAPRAAAAPTGEPLPAGLCCQRLRPLQLASL